jgi:putative aldouronate transport system permease protein
MALKHTRGENIFNVFNTVIILSIMVLTLYPLYHILMASFSQSSIYISHRGLMLYPVGTPTLFSYRAVFQNKSIS